MKKLSAVSYQLSARTGHTRRACIVLAALILLVLSGSCLAGEVTRTLADGVTFVQIVRNEGAEPMAINVLKIDTKNPNVKIESALAGDTVLADDATQGRETVSRLAARTGALAAVNADYFPFTGDPLGIAIVNGDLVSEPFQGRAALGISRGGWFLFDKLGFAGQVTSASGATFKIHGVNRLRGLNELICYTPAFGCATPARNDCVNVVLSGCSIPLPPNAQVEAAVQEVVNGPGVSVPQGGCVLSGNGPAAKFILDNLKPGEKVTLKLDLVSEMGKNWTPVVQAVGGGPWLVRSGQVYVDWAAQKFDGRMALAKHPRTAVGMTADKQLLLVTVDGRQWISRGMTLMELAELMISLGSVTAINLDGGGSTEMSIRGLIVNSPSEGAERPVANCLIVRAGEPKTASPDVRFSLSELTAHAGVGQKLALIDAATGLELKEPELSRVVWGFKGGRGFVNQSGFFVPLRAGSGTITALLGEKRADLPVTVLFGEPATLTASIKADPSGAAGRGLVEARVTDKAGNPISGKPVTIAVTGGAPDVGEVVTDARGAAVFGVTWDTSVDPSCRHVVVSVGGLTPVSAKYAPPKQQ